MAFDGAFLHTVLLELNIAAGAYVEKIYEPSRDELLIHLKKKDLSGKLLIVTRNGSSRIGFTRETFENPQTPPMFCMLARKIFLPSKFIGARQPGLERIIELQFEATNEMGDKVYPKIICEFIGNSNNIILTDENGKIFDALSRSDITTSRLIMPGAKYEYPKSLNKINILEKSPDDIVSVVSELKGKTATALLNNCEGFSPLVCRELCFKGFADVDADIQKYDITVLKNPLQEVKESIAEKHNFTVLYENGMPKDFSFLDINQYGSLYEKKHFGTACELLDEFYGERDKLARLNKQNSDLIKNVSNLISRANRRMNIRIKELEGTNDREKYRIYGELIKANIHNIKPGGTYCEVVNFYDENMSTVRIELDPALSPASNAAKYFKEYKKSCTARQSLNQLIESDKKEIEYLDSVLYSLDGATCTADVAGIRDELIETGYIKTHKSTKRKNAPVKIEEHISLEGYRILVGHNNIQNDYITTRLSEKNDMWFHTKNIHGSHVVLKNGGKDISDETLKLCGMLAAKNSRAKDSSNVPVDYTPIRYVKKPAGAKPGMVIYTTNKTLYVTPWEK